MHSQYNPYYQEASSLNHSLQSQPKFAIPSLTTTTPSTSIPYNQISPYHHHHGPPTSFSPSTNNCDCAATSTAFTPHHPFDVPSYNMISTAALAHQQQQHQQQTHHSISIPSLHLSSSADSSPQSSPGSSPLMMMKEEVHPSSYSFPLQSFAGISGCPSNATTSVWPDVMMRNNSGNINPQTRCTLPGCNCTSPSPGYVTTSAPLNLPSFKPRGINKPSVEQHPLSFFAPVPPPPPPPAQPVSTPTAMDPFWNSGPSPVVGDLGGCGGGGRVTKCEQVVLSSSPSVSPESSTTTIETESSVESTGRAESVEAGYVCDVCGTIISRKSNLLRHKRIHRGVKSHPCPVCDKTFGRSDHLLTHLRMVHKHDIPKKPKKKCGVNGRRRNRK